ncbi:hypothetical protein THOM_0630 [Trachipleistophora hominis]|uniref:Uncharacterized protein n=1 Tax=Trachipleistophora hominis TaxID=72359 RepID=L7JYL0_TRAHO|nr:hypothetical protein THOM_0630 [Trachipleistophora hominis]
MIASLDLLIKTFFGSKASDQRRVCSNYTRLSSALEQWHICYDLEIRSFVSSQVSYEYELVDLTISDLSDLWMIRFVRVR